MDVSYYEENGVVKTISHYLDIRSDIKIYANSPDKMLRFAMKFKDRTTLKKFNSFLSDFNFIKNIDV